MVTFSFCSPQTVRNVFTRLKFYFAESELAEYSKLSLIKRGDWVSSRLALKQSYREYSNNYSLEFPDIILAKSTTGVPCILGNVTLYCSLSHSYQHGVGIVSRQKVGIDIEKLREHNKTLLEYIASEKEIELFSPSSSTSQVITIIWTIKESVLKTEGCGLAIPMKNIIIVKKNGSVFLVSSDHQVFSALRWVVQVFMKGEFVVSLAQRLYESEGYEKYNWDYLS